MAQCIYCKINKSNFRKREHVLPQSFGRFHPTNFILNDRNKKRDNKVCDDCNDKFGKELELYLGRDSYEGYILRSKYLGKQSN
ncbi:HNH endonuclease, partial [Legionella pneumophila]